MVASDGDTEVLTAAKPALAPALLHVLLVGNREEDFYLIRDILERTRSTLVANLDQAHSLEEAKVMLQQKNYGLVLFEHKTGDAAAVRFIAEFQHAGVSVPFMLLTENADEIQVAEILGSGTWTCVARSQLDGATLIRTMRNAVTLHSLQKEQQTAEHSLRKLSRAVEQSADTIFITNLQGVIEYVNPAFEALTGYQRDEICGKTTEILKSNEQGPDLYEQIWQSILAGNIYRGILINRKKNGELYYVEENICPVRDAAGQITNFIANGRDLTERMRLEDQLRQSQKMDAIGNLAGGVAHDFNNLLTIITSYSELALDAVPQNSPLESKIQEIMLAARRAAELTRQLLAFSRKQPQALRVADLNQVVARIAKTLPRLIGEDIDFTFVGGEGLGLVRVDPVQIEQVLMNLAANARDAMPQGGCLRIETSDVRLDDDYADRKQADIPTGRYALITVSDNGEGISPANLPHIFEPFYTTKSSDKGTGLGLATVYGIVKQNKAFIWTYSEPTMGTVFKIYLPCVDERDKASEIDDSRNVRVAGGSETILLVEDEDALRRATAEFLKLRGYNVLEAKDGLDALRVADNHGSIIHLLISDVVMPNMSGGQLGKELAQMRPDAKLLFVSGYPGKTVLDHKVVDVETNFLQKPYTLQQLSLKIRSALGPS
jgi:PAS domain S-box-containing protein